MTTTMVHERNWTKIGKDYTEGKEDRVGAIFDRMEWSMPESMAMMPGLGIKECIKQLRLPKVTNVAVSHEMAPFGLIGVECNYKNGRARVFALDQGCEIVILCSDFYPNR